jgi:flagellar hook assembly protein FlgD
VVIPFILAGSQAVQVAIYNAAGQRVRVLSTGPLEAGQHRLVWDGTDEQGHPAASGIYLCRLAAADRQQTRRLLLLR